MLALNPNLGYQYHEMYENVWLQKISTLTLKMVIGKSKVSRIMTSAVKYQSIPVNGPPNDTLNY